MVVAVVEAFDLAKTANVDEARALYAVASELDAADLVKHVAQRTLTTARPCQGPAAWPLALPPSQELTCLSWGLSCFCTVSFPPTMFCACRNAS